MFSPHERALITRMARAMAHGPQAWTLPELFSLAAKATVYAAHSPAPYALYAAAAKKALTLRLAS